LHECEKTSTVLRLNSMQETTAPTRFLYRCKRRFQPGSDRGIYSAPTSGETRKMSGESEWNKLRAPVGIEPMRHACVVRFRRVLNLYSSASLCDLIDS